MDDPNPWPEAISRGLTYAAWTSDGYASEASLRSLDQLANTGATDVAIVVTGYMDHLTDSTIEALPGRTPTSESVQVVADLARERGLRVSLKPHVDVMGGAYRGSIEPTDVDLWFDSYIEFLAPWVSLAERLEMPMFCIGTELESMTAYHVHWRSVIDEIRARFSGHLVYAANWTDLEDGDTIELFREVDLAGVDAYFPLSDTPQPSVTDMVHAWQHWLSVLEHIERVVGRPVIITEIGCMSRRGAPMSPWDYRGDEPVDHDVQARYYEATLRALPTSGALRGVFFWGWGITPPDDADGTHSPQNKPAEAVLRRFWLGSD